MRDNKFRRGRVLAAALALTLVFLGLSAYRWLVDPWPARIEFREDLPLCFTPDGRSFVFSDFGRLTFRDSATGRVRSSWSLPENKDTKIVVAGAFSPDGRTFAAAIRQNNAPAEVAFIDVASGQIRATGMARHPQVYEFGFTLDGTALRMGTANTSGFQELVSFDPTTGATEFIFSPAPPTPANGVVASSDGQFLLYLDSKGGSVSLHDVGPAPNPAPHRIGLTSAGASGAVGFSPDGRMLGIGRVDGTIDLWDISGRRLVKALHTGSSGHAFSIVFSPDGRTIAATLGNTRDFDLPRFSRNIYHRFAGGNFEFEPPSLIIIDLATGEPLARSANSFHLYYSPDGRTIATKDDDGRVRLRDLPKH